MPVPRRDSPPQELRVGLICKVQLNMLTQRWLPQEHRLQAHQLRIQPAAQVFATVSGGQLLIS